MTEDKRSLVPVIKRRRARVQRRIGLRFHDRLLDIHSERLRRGFSDLCGSRKIRAKLGQHMRQSINNPFIHIVPRQQYLRRGVGQHGDTSRALPRRKIAWREGQPDDALFQYPGLARRAFDGKNCDSDAWVVARSDRLQRPRQRVTFRCSGTRRDGDVTLLQVVVGCPESETEQDCADSDEQDQDGFRDDPSPHVPPNRRDLALDEPDAKQRRANR